MNKTEQNRYFTTNHLSGYNTSSIIFVLLFELISTLDWIRGDPLHALIFHNHICAYFTSAWLINTRFTVTKSLLKFCLPFVAPTTAHQGAVTFFKRVQLAAAATRAWNAIFILPIAVGGRVTDVNQRWFPWSLSIWSVAVPLNGSQKGWIVLSSFLRSNPCGQVILSLNDSADFVEWW